MSSFNGDMFPFRVEHFMPQASYFTWYHLPHIVVQIRALPLAVGCIFAMAHFWTPHLIPGTAIPVQVPGTFPMGFLAAWYFLRYRTMLPLTACHAVLYILLNKWVEAHL
jgi:membrane protease YdiL (CAAX protease family)